MSIQSQSESGIFLSVIVATCERALLLDRCMNALFEQSLSSDRFEIIVVDDGAKDRLRNNTETLRATRSWQRRSGPFVRYVPAFDSHGPAASRNLGAIVARGKVLAFTDDDCVPHKRWLEHAYHFFKNGPADAGWGEVEVPVPERPTDYERDSARLEEAGFTTANCFCRKETFFAVGGFDIRFKSAWREDSDLFFSLLKAKKKVAPVPDETVIHPVRPSFWGVSLQQQSKCIYDALLYKKSPQFYGRWVKPGRPWLYYWMAALVFLSLYGWASGRPLLGQAGALGYLVLTAYFLMKRLRGTRRSVSHVLEMALTSVLIPPTALFWRLVGGLKYNVVFI